MRAAKTTIRFKLSRAEDARALEYLRNQKAAGSSFSKSVVQAINDCLDAQEAVSREDSFMGRLVDTVLLLLILVIEVVLQTTDVIILSPDLRAAAKDLESYRTDYRFLQENGIRTITQLETTIPDIQSQIDNLETERSKADNTRRKARTPEAQQEAKDRKKELTQKIAPLRKKLRQAKKILDESPHLYELLQEEHRLEQAAYQRFKERMK